MLNNINIISIYEYNKINNISNLIQCNNEIKEWNIHKKMVSEIKQFKIKGVLIYTNGIKKFFVRFYLNKIKPENYKFTAYTFFGIKLIEFIFNNNKFFLKEKGKITCFEGSSQDFFEKIYKINIPIKNLSSWLIGLPGDSKQFSLSKIGRLKEIKHKIDSKEYIIKYHKYHNNIIPSLPVKIELNQGNNNINLKINDWILY